MNSPNGPLGPRPHFLRALTCNQNADLTRTCTYEPPRAPPRHEAATARCGGPVAPILSSRRSPSTTSDPGFSVACDDSPNRPETMMSEQGIRNSLSQCPFQILQCDSDGLVGASSGFFFEHAGQLFLITNWHVLSGLNPSSKIALHPQGRTPQHIMVKFVTLEADGIYATTRAQPVEIHDANGPKWYEHPDFGSDCDLVALPLARPTSCPPDFHKPANKLSSERVPVIPGTTVFVIGYPLALSVGPGLPLWKSGYIASEPNYGVRIGGRLSPVGGLAGAPDLPAFFLDSQTRQGMSGSPVFAAYVGMWNTVDPYAPGSVLTQYPDDVTRRFAFLWDEV